MGKLIDYWTKQDEEHFKHLSAVGHLQNSSLVNVPSIDEIKEKLGSVNATDSYKLIIDELVIKFDRTSIRFFDKGMFDFDVHIKKAYKAFCNDMHVRGYYENHDFQFEEGKTYEINQAPFILKRGFLFHKSMVWAMSEITPGGTDNTTLAEVEILGDIKHSGHRFGTNKLKITKVLSKEEMEYMLFETNAK